jgi:hypothetical protein
MSKYVLLCTAAFVLAISPASYAADEATCQQLFDRADADKNATIAGTEVTPFAAAYKASDPSITTPDADLTITKEQFSAACMKDAFKDVSLPQ